jgi:hypothetical protein
MHRMSDEYLDRIQPGQGKEGGNRCWLQKPSLRYLLAVALLVFALGPAPAAAIGQEGKVAQAAGVVEASSDSAIPRLIQFSGTVKDADGKPAANSVPLTFSLYQFEEGGSPLWVETQTVQLDSQGRYTTLLGATSPGGLPQDLFTSGSARWLGVQPSLPGAGEQPRALLVGVPYAFKAADAETLGGKPASAYVTTDILNASGASAASGNVAPTSATPATTGNQDRSTAVADQERKKAASAGPLTPSCSSITADGTATANQVAKFTAACKIHQSQIFDNGTDVGIGTAAPGATLDVNGNISGRDNLGLPQTTKSSVGVFTLGGSPFVHACCSSSVSNTFVGVNAGNFTTSGVGHNTATGFKALFANTTGNENTATGYFALSSNQNGNSNTAFGHEALTSNTTGFNNTAVGFSALLSDGTGNQNTAVGDSALANITKGFNNTAIGFAADSGDITGSYNTSLGFQAGTLSSNLTNATAIGAFAGVDESNAIVLGCSLACPNGATTPNVGIGTNTPGATLDINAPNQVGLFVRGPVNGIGAGLDFQTVGTGGLRWEILDTGNFSAQGPNKLNIRNINTGNDIFTILSNGAVGIETVNPDNTLTVNGSADKPGGGSWGTFSDGRLKTVENSYDTGLDAILKLTPVRYRYKEHNAMGIKDSQEHVGFVAQDVERAIPEAVSRNSQGYLLVNNDPILWTIAERYQTTASRDRGAQALRSGEGRADPKAHEGGASLAKTPASEGECSRPAGAREHQGQEKPGRRNRSDQLEAMKAPNRRHLSERDPETSAMGHARRRTAQGAARRLARAVEHM